MADARLAGRVALVTGGGRGIGREACLALRDAGAPIAVCDIDAKTAEETANELAGGGVRVGAYALDVCDPEAFTATVNRIEREIGAVDILVNNAGIMPLGAFLDQPATADRRQIEINLFGVMNGMRELLPRMAKRERGHVVNIASVAGRIGTPYAAVYSASKFGVIGLTEAIRYEMRHSGVDFSFICPALVETELIAGAGRPKFPPPVKPKQVADAIVDAIVNKRVEVFVPKFSRLSVILPVLLGRRLSDKLGEAFDIGEMFNRVDPKARARYQERILGDI